MKNINKEYFLNEFIRNSNELTKALDESVAEWLPDAPPDTALFADLGRELTDLFEKMEPDLIKSKFELIEQAMSGSNNYIADIVATGMIEAMINGCFEDKTKMDFMMGHFGIESLKHAKAWIDF